MCFKHNSNKEVVNIYIKKDLLKALKTILKEYKNSTHRLNKTDCSLCTLYLQGLYGCGKCPMRVFDLHEIGINHLYGDRVNPYPCLNRKCEPVNCALNSANQIIPIEKRLRVIAYYEAIIKKISGMTEKELNVRGKGVFKFLLDIDNEIAKMYDLK